MTNKIRTLSLSLEQYQQRRQNIEGLRLDQFLIGKSLKNYCEYFKAKNIKTNEKFIVKLIKMEEYYEERQSNSNYTIRRHQQNQIMQTINCENVLKCYEVFQNQNFKILILEYFQLNLKQFINIKQELKLSEKQSIQYTKQILRGLSHLHRQNIIHRGLRCQNIFIISEVIKIGGFDHSKYLQDNQSIQSNSFFEKNYKETAPQIVKDQSYSLKADIYSVGVIFMQMLFGDFLRISVQQFAKIIFEKNPNKKCPLSENIQGFVSKCITNASKRFDCWEAMHHPLIPNSLIAISNISEANYFESQKSIQLVKLSYIHERKINFIYYEMIKRILNQQLWLQKKSRKVMIELRYLLVTLMLKVSLEIYEFLMRNFQKIKIEIIQWTIQRILNLGEQMNKQYVSCRNYLRSITNPDQDRFFYRKLIKKYVLSVEEKGMLPNQNNSKQQSEQQQQIFQNHNPQYYNQNFSINNMQTLLQTQNQVQKQVQKQNHNFIIKQNNVGKHNIELMIQNFTQREMENQMRIFDAFKKQAYQQIIQHILSLSKRIKLKETPQGYNVQKNFKNLKEILYITYQQIGNKSFEDYVDNFLHLLQM